MTIAAQFTRESADAGTVLREAQRLAPLLRARAADAIAARRLPRESIDDLRTSGLPGVYVPKRFGGGELPMAEVLPAVAEVARGCAASAWVLAVYQIHNWVVALLPAAAQDAVFADGPDPLIAASLNPMKNTARAVAGGFLIECASFSFCSGGPAREWVLGGVQVLGDDSAVVDVGALLIAGTDLVEKDDWFVSGLQATGSLSLTCENLFVPAHCFLSYATACAGSSPGRESNREPLYNAAFVPMLVLNLGGPALGIAVQALADFSTLIESKPGAYPITGESRRDAPQAHVLLAEAEMRIDIARMLLDRAGAVIREASARPGRMPRALAAKTCVDTTWASRECMNAVVSLFLHSGGAVLTPGHPLQQAFQDISAINCHGFLSHESAVRLYGSLVTGHEEPAAFV